MVERSNSNPEILGSNLGHAFDISKDEYTLNLVFNHGTVYAKSKKMLMPSLIGWRNQDNFKICTLNSLFSILSI